MSNRIGRIKATKEVSFPDIGKSDKSNHLGQNTRFLTVMNILKVQRENCQRFEQCTIKILKRSFSICWTLHGSKTNTRFREGIDRANRR